MLLTEESKTTSNLSTVHTALDEFENEAFTLNTNKLFSVRPMWTNLKTQQPPFTLDLCLKKTRSGKSRDYRDVIVVFQMFYVHTKTKSRHFPILPV